MKKHLLVTSALVAAGMIGMSGSAVAQKKAMGPSVTVSGSAAGYFGFSTNKESGLAGVSLGGATSSGAGDEVTAFNVKYDSEVHFTARVMTDNGLVIQTHMELEGPDSDPGPGEKWDEAYFRVDGSFGAFRLGLEDAVIQLMVTGYYGIWATAVGTQYDVEVGDWIVRPAGFAFDPTPMVASGDEGRITYITPRMQGFQLGVSYAPTDEADDASTGLGVPRDSEDEHSQVWKSSDERDLISVAANFDQKFGETRLGIAAGWETWTPAFGAPTEDMNYFSVGASVENGPFKVAAGFRSGEGSSLASAGGGNGSGEGESYQAGARYTQGANAFSAGVHYSKLDGAATAGTDKELGLIASYARTLAPGTKVSLNALYADYNNETGGADNDGFALLGVIHLRF